MKNAPTNDNVRQELDVEQAKRDAAHINETFERHEKWQYQLENGLPLDPPMPKSERPTLSIEPDAEVDRLLEELLIPAGEPQTAATLNPPQKQSFLDRLQAQQRDKGQSLADLAPKKELDQQQGHGLEQEIDG